MWWFVLIVAETVTNPHSDIIYLHPTRTLTNSMASGAVVAFALENLVIVTTCIMLAGQLRKAEDLFGVSQEIQRAGCCTLASLGK